MDGFGIHWDGCYQINYFERNIQGPEWASNVCLDGRQEFCLCFQFFTLDCRLVGFTFPNSASTLVLLLSQRKVPLLDQLC